MIFYRGLKVVRRDFFGDGLRRDSFCDGSLYVGGEFERDDGTRIQIDGFSGFRVARRTRLAFLAGECPKPAELYRVAFDEGFGDNIKKLLDDDAHLAFHDAG